MDILHILATLGSGGIQGFVYSMAYEQAKLGHSITVVITDVCENNHAYKQEKYLAQNGVKVIRLNRRKGSKWELIKSLFRCRRIVGAVQPDLVNSHGSLWHLFGAVSCMGRKIQHICTVHSSHAKWSGLTQLLCRSCSVIYCSKAAYDNRTQSNKEAVVIENGVSPIIVRTEDVVDLRKEFNLAKSAKVIVSVGNLRPPKNYKNLIELAKILDGTDIHFFICGANHGGPAYDDPSLYEGYSNLHCLGARSDVSAIENGADVFLSSSVFEGLPIAVLEAYYNGIPCVLSPIQEHKNIADVPMVWVPNDFTPNSFIAALKSAFECKLSHGEIYELRKPFISRFGIERTADKYLAFYTKSLNV